MNALINTYGVSQEVSDMKAAMLDFAYIEDMESGDTDEKEDLIADVITNVTTKALGISGEDFVDTMSDAAVEYFSSSSLYWATEGNFTMYNSAKWSYKKPHSKPENAFKCAAQRGKCECTVGSTIYYGAKTDDDRLDESQDYFKGEADFSGSTFCKNSIFGDPIPGTSKYCFCDELSGALHPEALFCADDGADCECDDGNVVAYGTATTNDNGDSVMDLSYVHWEKAAKPSGTTNCNSEYFGADAGMTGQSCFCEGPPLFDSFCDNTGVETKIGCYEDEEYDQDFEELLSTSIYKPQECLDLAWEAGYIYAGIQAGSDCWGSSKTVGKHGAKDDCTYKCSNGQECGGQYSNTIYMFAFTKDEFCGATEYLEMVNTVGYNTDIITYAQATLTNPSDDGINFIWTDKDDNSWTMEAVRQTDGKIKGFRVGEECPYYDSWNYASLSQNPDGEYALISSWPDAAEDFTIVYEFAEFGVGYAQEGKNWIDYEDLIWSGYLYKSLSESEEYGFWYTVDEDLAEFHYYDSNGYYCPGSFDTETSIMTITDPFNSCPHVANGWTSAYVTFEGNDTSSEAGPISMTGPDLSEWDFYNTDEELLEALYATDGSGYYFDSPDFYTVMFESYLLPTDW